jgi:hypothetical protein
VRQVLVLGVEEFDPVALDAYRSSHWLQNGFAPGEGAAGILIREATPEDALMISDARDGFIYRTRKEAAAAARELFGKAEAMLPVFPTASFTWAAPLEAVGLAGRTSIPDAGPYLGSAFTASAAWQTLRALRHPGPAQKIMLPLWGLNHQFGALVLEKRKVPRQEEAERLP